MTSAQSAKDIASIPLYKDGALVGSLDRTPDGCRISYATAVPLSRMSLSSLKISYFNHRISTIVPEFG